MVIFTPLPLSFFLCIKIHFTLFLRNSLLKLVMAWGHKQIYIDIHIRRVILMVRDRRRPVPEISEVTSALPSL